MTIDRITGDVNSKCLNHSKNGDSSRRPSESVITSLYETRVNPSQSEWEIGGEKQYDKKISDFVDHIYGDMIRLDQMSDLESISYSDLMTFHQPLLVLEQVIQKILSNESNTTEEDLVFVGLTPERLYRSMSDFPEQAAGYIVDDILANERSKLIPLTCQEMKEKALYLVFDLDLLLTSQFAPFPNDPYIVFSLRLLGVSNLSGFIELLDAADKDEPVEKVIKDFVDSSASIVREMTVNQYVRILLELPDKAVHLKKVLFHRGGIFYARHKCSIISKYVEFEVLGLSSISDFIQILLPVSNRGLNLLQHLERWITNKRELCLKRTCSEQRHIWSGLLLFDDEGMICDEPVHPYFFEKGGVLSHTNHHRLKSLNGKILNYLGIGSLRFWEELFKIEESKKADVKVIDVIEKVTRERQEDIDHYLQYTETKVRKIIRGGMECYEDDFKNLLRNIHEARPDLCYKIIKEYLDSDPDVIIHLIKMVPDIVICYLTKPYHFLLEGLDDREVANVLTNNPWAWSAFSESVLERFAKKKRQFENWESVLSNPLSWNLLLTEGDENEKFVQVSFSNVIRRIVVELDTDNRNTFNLFMAQMIKGDSSLRQKIERLLELGACSWMMFIDPKHHQYGPYVYDKGYHGGLVEPGYLEGMYAGLIWCAIRLSRLESPDEEFTSYQMLNRIVYRHNYRQVGGEVRSDQVLRRNNATVTKNNLELHLEAIREWDERVALPVVPVDEIEEMILDDKDTGDRFTYEFKKALDIKKHLKEMIYKPYNESLKHTKKQNGIIQVTARKHKQKELLHVFRDGVSRTNWLELNLDLVRNGLSLTLIEPNDSYTYPEKEWARSIHNHLYISLQP
jgi:hypothetical protein